MVNLALVELLALHEILVAPADIEAVRPSFNEQARRHALAYPIAGPHAHKKKVNGRGQWVDTLPRAMAIEWFNAYGRRTLTILAQARQARAQNDAARAQANANQAQNDIAALGLAVPMLPEEPGQAMDAE